MALLTLWAGSFFVVRGCPVCCRIFSGVPLPTRCWELPCPCPPTPPPIVTVKNISWGRRQKPLLLESHQSEQIFGNTQLNKFCNSNALRQHPCPFVLCAGLRSVVLKPATRTPGSSLEMLNLRPHPGPAELGSAFQQDPQTIPEI